MTDARRDAASGDPFEGFRAGARATTIPSQFFTEVLPGIVSVEELRVTLYALYAITRTGSPPVMRASAIAAEEPLARAFAHHGGAAAVRAGLDAAVARGVLRALVLDDGDLLVVVNTDAGRRLLTRIEAGAEPAPGGAVMRPSEPTPAVSRPAQMYEQEIGLLTPAVTAALAEAEAKYPPAWIVDAIRLAAVRNARSWRYAEAILHRWETEGRDDESAGGPAGRPANPFDALIHRD
ncbi:MAG: DnaD domain protein [Acidimicrobiia bacterium]|nr:DnaD domain protein [Acidimicrobiia bacterium]